MQEERSGNTVFLRGEVAAAPSLSHHNHGEDYWTFPMAVRRFSGNFDTLNIIVTAALLEQHPLNRGDTVEVTGEVRSYNNRSGTGSRLVISVYARSVERGDGEHENKLMLSGVLCKPAVLRRTPLGRDICDMMLAVNRRYGRSDYLPCIAWGALARRCAGRSVGDRLTLEGRLQSRSYIKQLEEGSEERIALEVSIMQLREDEAGESVK